MGSIGNSNKTINSYIHMYIGCQVMDLYNNKIGKLIGVSEKEVLVMHQTQWGLTHEEVKPILRRLSSMKEEEAAELIILKKNIRSHDEFKIYDICDGHVAWTFKCNTITRYIVFDELNSNQFSYLLSKGFDLFGLIDSNLAIDSENKQ